MTNLIEAWRDLLFPWIRRNREARTTFERHRRWQIEGLEQALDSLPEPDRSRAADNLVTVMNRSPLLDEMEIQAAFHVLDRTLAPYPDARESIYRLAGLPFSRSQEI